MAVNTKQYQCLRDDFLKVAQCYINDTALNTLKQEYASTIASTRKLSCIKDFQSFIRTLEKRDALNYSNIGPLIYISHKFINLLDLQRKLLSYKDSIENSSKLSLRNMYQDELDQEQQLQKTLASTSQSTFNEEGNMFVQSSNSAQESQQKTLLHYLGERLGRSWRDVSRHLGLRECEIDAIHSKYPFDLKEQSYQALQVYFKCYASNDWKIKLIEALEKGRRRDLRDFTQKTLLETKT